MVNAAGPSLHDVVSHPLTFNEMSRCNWSRNRIPKPLFWEFATGASGPNRGAVPRSADVDLGMTKRVPQQRIAL
jgi:hypothetical protein